MKLKPWTYFLVAFLLLFMYCTKKDTSNKVPVLNYNNFKAIDYQLAEIYIDFEDGDGDLFQFKDSRDPNFFLEFEYKDTAGNFKPALWPISVNINNKDTIIFQKNTLKYTVNQPKDLASDQYIRGTVMITLTGWRPSFLYKKFRYKLYAIDRRGNKSDEIYTKEINVNF
jgi:hypothetical protein